MFFPSIFFRSGSMAATVLVALFFAVSITAISPMQSYTLDVQYTGDSFFSNFDFFDGSDTRGGFTNYVDYQTAINKGLVSTDDDGTNYMQIATSGPIMPAGRDAVRITTQRSFTHGLIITDLVNMPGGVCGIAPGHYTLGIGEIDIIRGVNEASENTMTLFTDQYCIIASSLETGQTGTTNCSSAAGCSVIDNSGDISYGTEFNRNNGGVFATQWESDGINIWFFEPGSIPADITAGTPDPILWGVPVANYPSQASCNIDSTFSDNKIVFDTAFCNPLVKLLWSGSNCAQVDFTCEDFVTNHPELYDSMYWAVRSLTIYDFNGDITINNATSNSTSSSAATPSLGLSSTTSSSEAASSTSTTSSSAFGSQPSSSSAVSTTSNLSFFSSSPALQSSVSSPNTSLSHSVSSSTTFNLSSATTTSSTSQTANIFDSHTSSPTSSFNLTASSAILSSPLIPASSSQTAPLNPIQNVSISSSFSNYSLAPSSSSAALSSQGATVSIYFSGSSGVAGSSQVFSASTTSLMASSSSAASSSIATTAVVTTTTTFAAASLAQISSSKGFTFFSNSSTLGSPFDSTFYSSVLTRSTSASNIGSVLSTPTSFIAASSSSTSIFGSYIAASSTMIVASNTFSSIIVPNTTVASTTTTSGSRGPSTIPLNVDAVDGYLYLGCFALADDLFSINYTSDVNDVTLCTATCNPSKYAIIHESTCYCSEYLSSMGVNATQLLDAKCINPCPGNSTEACGGGGGMDLRKHIVVEIDVSVYILRPGPGISSSGSSVPVLVSTSISSLSIGRAISTGSLSTLTETISNGSWSATATSNHTAVTSKMVSVANTSGFYSIIYSTSTYTITSCAPTVTNCPARLGMVITEVSPAYTTWFRGNAPAQSSNDINQANSPSVIYVTAVVTTYTDWCPGVSLTETAATQIKTLFSVAGVQLSAKIPMITATTTVTLGSIVSTLTLTTPHVSKILTVSKVVTDLVNDVAQTVPVETTTIALNMPASQTAYPILQSPENATVATTPSQTVVTGKANVIREWSVTAGIAAFGATMFVL